MLKREKNPARGGGHWQAGTARRLVEDWAGGGKGGERGRGKGRSQIQIQIQEQAKRKRSVRHSRASSGPCVT